MPRLFVFGIGGTGSRVMKSLVMLLSSGIKPAEFEIVPVLIDPHKDLRELNSLKSLLKLYSEIHSRLYKDVTGVDNGFFRTKISTLRELSPNSDLDDEFEFDEKHNQSFRAFLKLADLNKNSVTHDLMSLLYSQNNLNDSLSKGFRGNPNIGSVVLGALKKGKAFGALKSTFGKDDRIFIVSSMFGGTGAAGFPLLLNSFRQSDNSHIKNSKISSLSIMPYFKLTEPNEDSIIDSNNFVTKTKSALTYYIRPEIAGLCNSMYYLADPYFQGKSYENNEQLQNNNAHLIELLGATAILHFAKSQADSMGDVYEYCLEDSNERHVTFKDIGKRTSEEIGRNLINFTIFSKLIDQIKAKKDLPFLRYKSQAGIFESESPLFENLNKLLKQNYLVWLKELKENERALSAFNLTDASKLHSLVNGYSIESRTGEGWLRPSYDISQIFFEMGNEFRTKESKELGQHNRATQLIAACHSAVDKVNNRIKF